MQLGPPEQHREDAQVRVQESARIAETRHLDAHLLLRRNRSPQKQREEGGHAVLEVGTNCNYFFIRGFSCFSRDSREAKISLPYSEFGLAFLATFVSNVRDKSCGALIHFECFYP